MPSGSHGGGGGSHFGGGFSGGGSHFGGSSGSHHTTPRNVVIFWGGRRYIYSGKAGSTIRTFFLLFVVSVVFALFSGLIWGSSCGNKSKIENDYKYYQQMITRAEFDSDYLTTGVITDHFYNEDCDKWYFTYSITTYDGKELEGYTFSIYTLKELDDWPVDKVIDVAVSSKLITLRTDSVPMNYKDVPLEKDGEYVSAINSINIFRVATIILIALSATFLVLNIVFAVKLKDAQQPAEEKKEEQKTEKKDYWVCEYCGNRNKLDDLQCGHCGAKKG